jgi:uncharacterized membrane protein YeiH
MDLFTIVSFIGSAAFALSGYVVGVRKQLDIMGVFIVSMLPAYGGGAMRDVLLGHTPAVLSDMTAFILVCVVIAVATLMGLNKNDRVENKLWFVVSDSIGLVAFAITGALMGIAADLSLFGVMVLAFVTASGGGILRDILVNETPTLLKSDIYGSIALLAAAALYGLHTVSLSGDITTVLVFIGALMLRLAAYHYKWRLPLINAL